MLLEHSTAKMMMLWLVLDLSEILLIHVRSIMLPHFCLTFANSITGHGKRVNRSPIDAGLHDLAGNFGQRSMASWHNPACALLEELHHLNTSTPNLGYDTPHADSHKRQFRAMSLPYEGFNQEAAIKFIFRLRISVPIHQIAGNRPRLGDRRLLVDGTGRRGERGREGNLMNPSPING